MRVIITAEEFVSKWHQNRCYCSDEEDDWSEENLETCTAMVVYKSTGNPDPETIHLIEPPIGMNPQALENIAAIDQNLEATQALFESDQDKMKADRLETLRLGHRAALDSLQDLKLHIPDRLKGQPMTIILNNHSTDLFGPGPPVSRGDIERREKGGMEHEETDKEIVEQGEERREELGESYMDWAPERQVGDGRVAAPADPNAFWLSPGTPCRIEQKACISGLQQNNNQAYIGAFCQKW